MLNDTDDDAISEIQDTGNTLDSSANIFFFSPSEKVAREFKKEMERNLLIKRYLFAVCVPPLLIAQINIQIRSTHCK